MDDSRPGVRGPEQMAKQTVERLRERVIDNPEDRLTPEDRNAIIRFDEEFSTDRRKNGRSGWQHHANKLRDLIAIAEETECLAAALEDSRGGRRAVDEIVTWITEQDASEYTIQDNLSSIRVFAETVLGELPERFAEIKPSAHVTEDPAPLPSNIVEFEDLVAMIEVTDSSRDCALYSTEWGGGFRPQGELWLLQYKHVDIRDGYAVISLEEEGKTDRHDVAICTGVSWLDKWIHKEHPVHDDPEAELNPDTFIWTRDDRNVLLSYGGLAERFDVAADKAGLQVDHSPQHFRRSCASILARQPGTGLTDLMERFSWARASDAPWHYISAHSNPTNSKVLSVRGHDVDDLHDEPETAPIVCPRCGDWTMRGLSECVWCPESLDPDQTWFEHDRPVSPQTDGEKNLAQLIMDGDVTADDLRTLRELETVIKTEQDLFRNIDDLIVKAEGLEDALEQQGDSVSSLLGVGGLLGQVVSGVGGVARSWAQRTHAALRIHPAFAKYPPRGPDLVGLVSAWLVLVAIGGGLAASSIDGSPDPALLVATIASVSLGVGLVARELPSVGDALEAVAEET